MLHQTSPIFLPFPFSGAAFRSAMKRKKSTRLLAKIPGRTFEGQRPRELLRSQTSFRPRRSQLMPGRVRERIYCLVTTCRPNDLAFEGATEQSRDRAGLALPMNDVIKLVRGQFLCQLGRPFHLLAVMPIPCTRTKP